MFGVKLGSLKSLAAKKLGRCLVLRLAELERLRIGTVEKEVDCPIVVGLAITICGEIGNESSRWSEDLLLGFLLE